MPDQPDHSDNESRAQTAQDDHLLRIMFGGVSARAHLVRIHRSWLEVNRRHDEAPEVMQLLGQMSCASILLSASLKYEGSVTLQIHGDGPVRLAVAECNSTLGFRSTVKMAESQAVSAGADWQTLVNASGMGRFSVVLDPRTPDTTPYQGIVSLHEEGLSKALEAYMDRSEQLPTRLWLACDGERAAGLLLQRMPPEGGTSAPPGDDDGWEQLLALASTVTDAELLAQDSSRLLHQLFWQASPRLLEDRPVQFQCGCSRIRVGRMLQTLGREEVSAILTEQGNVSVRCDFCNTAYDFDAIDCVELFTEAGIPSSEGPATLH